MDDGPGLRARSVSIQPPSGNRIPGSTRSTGPSKCSRTEATVASRSKPICRCVSRTRPAPVRAASSPTAGPSRCCASWGTGPGPEADLAEERVPRPDQRLEVRRAPAVAGVDEPRPDPVRPGHAEAEARVVVRDVAGFDREAVGAADRDGPLGQDLDVERGRGEPGFRVQRIEPIGETGRPDDPDPAPQGRLPAQVEPERDQVHEVVRMQMADDDRIEVRRVQQPRQPRERALAQVQEEGTLAVRQQIRRTGRAGAVRVRGSGADDREVHGA